MHAPSLFPHPSKVVAIASYVSRVTATLQRRAFARLSRYRRAIVASPSKTVASASLNSRVAVAS